MYQVAQMAGIGQGTLYRRYASKSKLCLAVMRNKLDLFIEEMEEYLQEAKEQSVLERFSKLIEMIVDLIHKDMEWLKAVTHSERLEEAKENFYNAPPALYIVNKIKELLEEALGRGELINLDPRFTSRMIVSSFPPMLLLHLRELGYSPEQITKEYCKTFVVPLFIHKQVNENN